MSTRRPSDHARIVMTNIVDADRFRTRSLARGAGGGDGGYMDDVLRRLGVVESLVAETREDVSAIKATLPHLATKAEVKDLKADISSLETRIIRWIVGTTITVASVAFTIAKFVN
jgi:hypothetical protein